MIHSNDGNGRFAPGRLGGPGSAPRATQSHYLAVLSEAVTPEKWRAIVEKAVQRAVAGDSEAREWLGTYLIGTPTAVELGSPGESPTVMNAIHEDRDESDRQVSGDLRRDRD